MLFALAAIAFSTISWYWARVLLLLRPEAVAEQNGVGWTARNAPRLCALTPMVLLALALWQASTASPQGRWPLVTLAAIFLLLGALAWPALYLRRRVIETKSFRAGQLARPFALPKPNTLAGKVCNAVPALTTLPSGTVIGMVLTAVPGFLLLLFFARTGAEASQWASSLGPMAILFIGLGFCIPIGSVLVLWGERLRLPLLTMVVLAAVLFSAFDLNDNHEVRRLDGVPPAHAPRLHDTFREWLSHRRDFTRFVNDRRPEGRYPVVFVAAEGGGIRAAYQTAQVLAQLQDADRSFVHHVFAISGVSGGSLGASVFAALAASRDPAATGRPFPETGSGRDWQTVCDDVLSRDLLSPPLAAALSPDLFQRFLPLAIPKFDRARALEAAFETAWEEGTRPEAMSGAPNPFASSFYAFQQGLATRSVPALFLNTTRVETGGRIVVCPVKDIDTEYSRLKSLAGIAPNDDIRLSTAVCLSARFPAITSTGYLPVYEPISAAAEEAGPSSSIGTQANPSSRPRQTVTLRKYRFVDGGYYENSGLSTLIDLLVALRMGAQLSGKKQDWYPVVIRIGAPPPEEVGDPAAVPTECARPQRPRRGDGFEEGLTPLRALFQTRDAHGVATLRRLETILRMMGEKEGTIEFKFQQRRTPIPLGWLLSRAARADLRDQVTAGDPHPVKGALRDAAPAPGGLSNGGMIGAVLRRLTPEPATGS
jgi:hypothetical protein